MKNYGLLGHTLSHSISPLVHNIIMDYIGISGTYYLLEREENEIESLLLDIKHNKINGINITIPYKETVFPMLDNISDDALNIGAVNTVCFKDNKLTGYNTDYYGFIKMLECNNIDAKGKHAVILGSGGSSKGVSYALDMMGAKKVTIVSRNPDKSQSKHDIISYDILNDIDYDIIINTTPVGMYPKADNSPLDEALVKKAQAVVDIIYRPMQTKLLKTAEDNNIKNINGLYMLAAQAVRAQAIWNDIEFTNEDYDNIYKKVLGGYDFG